MKTLKLLQQIPLSVRVGDKRYGVREFLVSRGAGRPVGFVLAAGAEAPGGGAGTAPAAPCLREVDLSAVYRSQPDFENALEEGFELSESQFEAPAVRLIIAALEAAKSAAVE